LMPIFDVLMVALVIYIMLLGGAQNAFVQQNLVYQPSPTNFLDMVPVYSLILGLIFMRLMFKGVKPYHGAEHKLIMAAYSDDVAHARDYSPVALRCGSTYYPSIIIVLGTWSLLLWYFNLPSLGFFTLMALTIIVEKRYFHDKNKLGLWVGGMMQKYLLTSEPDPELMEIGITGMKELEAKEASFPSSNS
jgi:uncharacterized protein YqhQ